MAPSVVDDCSDGEQSMVVFDSKAPTLYLGTGALCR